MSNKPTIDEILLSSTFGILYKVYSNTDGDHYYIDPENRDSDVTKNVGVLKQQLTQLIADIIDTPVPKGVDPTCARLMYEFERQRAKERGIEL